MLSVAVERHVALMRACGFLFDEQAALLTDYAAFAKARGDVHVRTATVLDWSRKAASRLRRRTLYLTVRRFALVMVAEDACHEVPPPDLLPRAAKLRPAPYIYAQEEIAALVAAADRAASRRCRVPGQDRVPFGLLAATGMRISEALGVDIAGITPDGLLIREAKRRGRRLLPLHPTTEAALEAHLVRRARVYDASEAIFLGDRGGRLGDGTARSTFWRMLALAGLTGVASEGRNRASTIFAIPLRSARSRPARRSAEPQRATWWRSALGSVMSTSSTPTGSGRHARRAWSDRWRTEAFAAGDRP